MLHRVYKRIVADRGHADQSPDAGHVASELVELYEHGVTSEQLLLALMDASVIEL